jgi:hypothetical protein
MESRAAQGFAAQMRMGRRTATSLTSGESQMDESHSCRSLTEVGSVLKWQREVSMQITRGALRDAES